MWNKIAYARMMTALNTMPHHIQVQLGLDTHEARQRRAHAAIYGE